MFFSMDVIRARKGDCLLIHFGSEDDPRLIVIDGGPSGVYRPHLKPRLQMIHAARDLSEDTSLPVDVLMVSHVDDDHTKGILDMTKEMIEERQDNKTNLLRIFSLWHNSFDNVIGSKPDELTSGMEATFGQASAAGELPVVADLDTDEGLGQKEVHAGLRVLASIRQGAQLRRDAEKLEIDINPEFDGGLIIAEQDSDVIELDGDLSLTVIGPMKGEVKALHKKHQDWLKKLEKDGKTPEDLLSAFVDKSVANLSSLVFLASVQGKTMLLTGDARGDKLLEGLELAGLLGNNDTDTIHVDVLKVPHHGSAHNVATVFFERITADHYVFSGDGEHGNPERETLEMLLEARGTAPFTMHFTYPIAEIDAERKKDWEKQQKREKKKKETKPTQFIREDWDPAKHSLAGLFGQEPDFGNKVKVVDDGSAHLIDLLDPVEF